MLDPFIKTNKEIIESVFWLLCCDPLCVAENFMGLVDPWIHANANAKKMSSLKKMKINAFSFLFGGLGEKEK